MDSNRPVHEPLAPVPQSLPFAERVPECRRLGPGRQSRDLTLNEVVVVVRFTRAVPGRWTDSSLEKGRKRVKRRVHKRPTFAHASSDTGQGTEGHTGGDGSGSGSRTETSGVPRKKEEQVSVCLEGVEDCVVE